MSVEGGVDESLDKLTCPFFLGVFWAATGPGHSSNDEVGRRVGPASQSTIVSVDLSDELDRQT